MVREIGERRDCRDDGDGPVPGESLWAAKPDLNMQQVTAQVRARGRRSFRGGSRRCIRFLESCRVEGLEGASSRLRAGGRDRSAARNSPCVLRFSCDRSLCVWMWMPKRPRLMLFLAR